jgi:hypothetical protein
MEFLRKGVLSKRQTINGQGQELVTTELNLEHPLVVRSLGLDQEPDDEEWDDDEEPAADGAEIPAETESAPAPRVRRTPDGGAKSYRSRFDRARLLASQGSGG